MSVDKGKILEALGAWGAPTIAGSGLFAAGNAQGDVFGQDYPVHYPGISHGRCVTFGQLVGEALAKGTVLTDIIEPVEG